MSNPKKSEAILLRKVELRETSLLLTFYTKESGKISGVIKGVRSPQPQFAGVYEPFTLDKVTYYEKSNKDLFVISQCDLLEYFSPIRTDIERIAYAGYFIEFVDSVCQASEKNEDIFFLLRDSLEAISNKQGSLKRIARIFEIKLLNLIGLMPRLKQCVECDSNDTTKGAFSIKNGGMLCEQCIKTDITSRKILQETVNFMEIIRTMPYEKTLRIKVSENVGKDLEDILRGFLDYHVQKRFKSLEFMKQIGI
jgi:DNA repair protein RecO (recombination protein O)